MSQGNQGLGFDGSPRKRDLVFTRVGNGSLHRRWAHLNRQDRDWDLQLSTYLDDNASFIEGDFALSVDRGTKWDSIARFFRSNPALLDQYEWIFFPDDDLLFEAGDVARLFQLCRENDLYIAQPALDAASYYCHPILLACPAFRLRFTTFVEPMAPCIKASYLRELLPYIEKHFTGWGIDHIWALLMVNPPFRAAVLDEITMEHTRPFETGAIYTSFKKMNADPRDELSKVMAQHGDELVGIVVYAGVLRNGRRLNGFFSRILNGLWLLLCSARSRNPSQTFRTAVGSLIRAVTMTGFQPKQLRAASEAGRTDTSSALTASRSPATSISGSHRRS